MMGLPPSEAKALCWWEYQALLWTWNDRHAVPDKEALPDAPDAAFVARRMARLQDSGLGKSIH